VILYPLAFTRVAAQAPCANLTSATGQPGWLLVSGPGINSPQVPVNVPTLSGWANPIAGSHWVSINANYESSVYVYPSDYTFEYTFCVCPQKKPSLALTFYADNGAQVYLNSTLIFSTSGTNNSSGAPKGSPTLTPYIGPALTTGTNTLRIVVRNENYSPMGLDALLKVSGAQPGCCRSHVSDSRRN
jgi:hypothetical protein